MGVCSYVVRLTSFAVWLGILSGIPIFKILIQNSCDEKNNWSSREQRRTNALFNRYRKLLIGHKSVLLALVTSMFSRFFRAAYALSMP